MGMIWKRLNDHGKNWRHVYKVRSLVMIRLCVLVIAIVSGGTGLSGEEWQ